jgi:hypothetical protein
MREYWYKNLFTLQLISTILKKQKGGEALAPKDNKNALKDGAGIQVNFYLSGTDVAAIKRVLAFRGIDVTDKEIRRFARNQSKNGIWQAIKGELPPIIL